MCIGNRVNKMGGQQHQAEIEKNDAVSENKVADVTTTENATTETEATIENVETETKTEETTEETQG